jgi:uncharacterized SAM-binding protein YcdF (DUF218 family)
VSAATAQVIALAEEPAAPFGPGSDAPAAGRGQTLAAALLLAAATCLVAVLALPSALPLARATALRLLAEALVQVDEPPAHADAVAVHGGGEADGSREKAAIALWKDGRADRLVAMGGPLPPGDPDITYARGVARRLRADGVPNEAILRLEAGGSTAGELVALRRLAEAEGWRRVVLSSSRWHTRRIALLAGQVFRASPVAWSVVAPPGFGFDVDRWWEERPARDVVLGEWAKIGVALLLPAEP